ncbi:MAG: hypothetical protein IPL15_10270 [Comamonadaceae bacterium]|uniref:hypothetical protein n=1 Tax=Candidatus Skiveiella danica TaxID=3386177 RepID=UPI00390A46AE|nr:hypothetical protein [Comamonadaceae bacterium]
MKIDAHSSTWLAVEAYAEQRLAEHRKRLESPLSWEETQATRAQMRELRLLLAEAQPTDAQYVALDTEQEIPQ